MIRHRRAEKRLCPERTFAACAAAPGGRPAVPSAHSGRGQPDSPARARFQPTTMAVAVWLTVRAGTQRIRMRLAGLAMTAGLLAVAACGGATGGGAAGGGEQATAGQQAAAGNPDLDPGTPLHGVPAPDFRLT